MSSFILKVNDDIPSKPKLQNMRISDAQYWLSPNAFKKESQRRLRNIAQTIKGMVKED